MFGSNRNFISENIRLKEIATLLSFATVGMLFLSLISYSPFDSSPFFISSLTKPTVNWCGTFGAYAASFLLFFFGSASYVVVLLCGLFLYALSNGISFRNNWERIVAGCGVIITTASLCNMHGIQYFAEITYGGTVGFYVTVFLYSLFDYLGSVLIVYTILLSSLIILIRFSCIELIMSATHMIRSIVLYLHRQRIFQRISRIIVAGGFLIGRQCKRVYRSFFALLDGSMAREARLLETDEHDQLQYPHLKLKQPLITSSHVFHRAHKDENASYQHTIGEHMNVEHAYDIERDSIDSFKRPRTYGLPSQDIFIGVAEKKEDAAYRRELEERASTLTEKLERFGVYGHVASIKSGPVVTLFEYQPDIDTKLSKILALEDDLALALQAHSIRILAPIPGRSVVGFEVSNTDRKDVLFAQVIQSETYEKFKGSLPLVLGKDTIGEDVVVDLAKMPHLLIAGSTGSGKSVCLNAMLISLLCRCTPDQLKLILIDPKRLEFASYADIAHLLFPIITNPKKAIPVLRWVVQEMEARYETMAEYGVRNIFDYNLFAKKQGYEQFPFIVVIIDELSDLMMTVGREIEDLITRVTQMARAAGIHMIVATQRPSVDVITGLIKVNFPSRISFRVTSKVDSRTILDCSGADKLLGRGDMLFLDSTASILRRIHGAYVSDEQIGMVVDHIRSQRVVEYLIISDQTNSMDSDISSEDEELFRQIISFLDEIDEISISLLQRKFRIGYNRSARFIDMLESRGYIMPADGGKPRRVIRGL